MDIEYADKAVQFCLDNGSEYCDVRAEYYNNEGFVIENGQVENISTSSDSGMGIRVLVNGSWGFYSISSPKSFEFIKDNLLDTIKSARYCSENKKHKVKLAEVQTRNDVVSYKIKIVPSLDEMLKIGFACDGIIKDKKRVSKSSVAIHHDRIEKYFVNSEGSTITQSYDDVFANLSATAHQSGLTQSVNTTEGGRGGLEMITESEVVFDAAKFVSQKADELLDAKTVKEEKATVVMNPDFVALLTHEILGHPSEADRVLGKEMAWAGGAWWAGKIGTQVGSSELNVIDDPTIESSLGWYKYDDEGVMATKKYLVKDGLLHSHMQSRETAALFDTKPDASMRATGYSFMPLVRMACTCIEPGDWNPEEMIKDVKNGYLISNMKIPSIDMMRYNWSISCQYAQKIENGELGQLLRDVIVMGTSPEFFKSIDARGNDFQVRPITNCGKGDPMQIMRMGNGGPHIRGMSTVKSVAI